jgi:hypothetical protein
MAATKQMAKARAITDTKATKSRRDPPLVSALCSTRVGLHRNSQGAGHASRKQIRVYHAVHVECGGHKPLGIGGNVRPHHQVGTCAEQVLERLGSALNVAWQRAFCSSIRFADLSDVSHLHGTPVPHSRHHR